MAEIFTILISHNRIGDEDWRMMRVLAAAQDFSQLWPLMASRVQRLHDHKGGLYVAFRGEVDEGTKASILRALEAIWERYDCAYVEERKGVDEWVEGELVFNFTNWKADYWQERP